MGSNGFVKIWKFHIIWSVFALIKDFGWLVSLWVFKGWFARSTIWVFLLHMLMWVDFWKCVLRILNDFGKCGCEWSDNYEFMQVKCEHVLFAYQVFDKLFIWDFWFDSFFLIYFKSCAFNRSNSQIIWASLKTITIF